MAEVQGTPGQETGGGGGTNAKGLFQSLSRGVRELFVLEQNLTGIKSEIDKLQRTAVDLQAKVERLLGTLPEMDKRIAERFAELDKRMAETDKRVQLQIELAVRNALDKRNDKASG